MKQKTKRLLSKAESRLNVKVRHTKTVKQCITHICTLTLAHLSSGVHDGGPHICGEDMGKS